MTEGKKKLTLLEASCIVAGLGVGGGIMAVPYLASLNGIIPVILIMLGAYGISLILHCMIAEIVLRDGRENQLVEIFSKYLFREGKGGMIFSWAFFILIVINFLALLAAYLVGCGEILINLFEIPLWLAEVLTFVVAAGVVFFGLKALGLSEKYAVACIAAVLLFLSLLSFGKPFNPIPLFSAIGKSTLAFYGMVMFCFVGFFSIPQTVEGLSWNKKLVPWAVVIGIGINFTFTFVTTVMAMLVSKEVTEVVIVGWGKALGPWVFYLGSLFVLLAILTSYWSVSYALAIVLVERLKWGYRASWLASTLPTLILALSGIAGFLGLLRMAGGAIAILVAIMVIPTLRAIRKRGGETVFDMGIWGSTAFQILIVLAYILAAAGSMVPIK